MSDYIEVDQRAIRSTGDDFETSSVDSNTLITDSLMRIHRLHGCWGTDETGKAFEHAYQPSCDGMEEGLKAVPQILLNYSGGLGSTANGYEKADNHAYEDVADLLRHFGRK